MCGWKKVLFDSVLGNGGDLILPPISCFSLFGGKHLREQLKVSGSSKVLDSLGQQARTMPRADLKLCSVSGSQGEEKSESSSCSSKICMAMVKM